MKTFKKILLPILLCFSILLGGCGISTFSDKVEYLENVLTPTMSAPDVYRPEESYNNEPGNVAPPQTGTHEYNEYITYEEFERSYEPYEEQIPFSEIEYVSPVAEPIVQGYEEVQHMVEEGSASAEEILDAYEGVFEEHLYFDTMHALSYIRYSLHLDDTYYDEEYNRCEELSPLLSQAQEKCYIAMSESPLRQELEEEYFGEDFFLFYDENRIYSKDSVVALMQKESEIESQYLALQNDPTILWNGKETSLDKILEDNSISTTDYLSAYRAYYEKYNPQAAELYAQIIRVRKEIAKELDYDSYADFAYSYTYERDYTPRQVEDYCNDIAEEMPSLLFTAVMAQAGLPYKDIDESVELFQKTVDSFGGIIRTSYDFMVDYELWDTSISATKLPGSYMTYLNSYEMPFLYVSPAETLGDLATLCHEFGHFVDGYVNCGGFSSVDCAEVFSQGLEYLALNRADLNPSDRSALIKSKAADAVLVFLTQACYAEFEVLAYSLPEKELNAEGLNTLFARCNEKYGLDLLYMGMEDLLAPGWIDVQHFYIAPYYVISYCVSNDAALQIYGQELASGDGLDLYYELLCQDRESTLPELMESTGLESPFADGRIRELADFLENQLR